MAELADTLAVTEDDRLDQAEALVRGYCRWHIAPSRADEEFVLRAATPVLLLPSLYVTAVAVADADGVALESDSYAWTVAGVVSRASCRWAAGTTVTFTHGYADVPPEVTAIVQAVAQRAVDNPGSKPREQAGPFADTFSQSGFNQAPALALLDAEKATLDRYRLPSLP